MFHRLIVSFVSLPCPTDDAQNMMSIAVSEYVLVLSSDSHSTIPMLGDWSQYGISVLMTDERASQVSHSS